MKTDTQSKGVVKLGIGVEFGPFNLHKKDGFDYHSNYMDTLR